MSAAFDRCLKKGGKIRTKKLADGSHMKICVLPKGEKGLKGGRTVGGGSSQKEKEGDLEMRLKKKVDNLIALTNGRFDEVDEVMKRLLGRAEIITILQEEVKNLREERKELLNRLMARDFASYQTYSLDGKEETVGEELKEEEDPDMAEEIFNVSEAKMPNLD